MSKFVSRESLLEAYKALELRLNWYDARNYDCPSELLRASAELRGYLEELHERLTMRVLCGRCHHSPDTTPVELRDPEGHMMYAFICERCQLEMNRRVELKRRTAERCEHTSTILQADGWTRCERCGLRIPPPELEEELDSELEAKEGVN